MDEKIFGRELELKKLERLYHSKNPEFLAVYGRRRVGKTFLIHEFFKDKGVYFSITGSKNTDKKTQIRKFFWELQNHFGLTNLNVPKDWDEALYTLKEVISKIDPSKKIILFFDEVPWLASKRSGFLHALEYIWNQHFSRMNNILLIICGSAASWIIKKVINNKEGLYGRLSEIIKLNAFTLDETEKFLFSRQVRLSRKQLVELYMCLGGIAKYLTYIYPGESTAQVINRLCFTPQGQLVGEFNNLYQSLFDDSRIHMQLIRTLSEKKSGLNQNELLATTKLSSGGQTSIALEELEESGFIAVCQEFQKKIKDRKFWLIDEYSYFYLSWMESMKGNIILGHDQDYWLKMQSQQKWKTWAGYAFEAICFKHIIQIKKALGISGLLTTESQWSYKPKTKSEKGAQIDLLIDRKDDCINLCEIKFHNSPFLIDSTYAQELQHKIETFRNTTRTQKTIFLTLVTPFGLIKNEYSIEFVNQEITLDHFFS